MDVYLGPFLVCKYHKVNKVKILDACPNPACNRHGKQVPVLSDTKFCPACGTEIGPVEVNVASSSTNDYEDAGVKVDTFYDLHAESSDGKLERWYAPNLGLDKSPRRFSVPEHHFGIILDSPPDHLAEMEWYSKTYGEAIEKLKTTFDSVEMKWGLVTSY